MPTAVKAVKVRATRTPGELIRRSIPRTELFGTVAVGNRADLVAARLLANGRADLHVDYQTQFFDASGRVIETTAWQTIVLPANTPYSVTAESTTPAAMDFQTTFRYAK